MQSAKTLIRQQGQAHAHMMIYFTKHFIIPFHLLDTIENNKSSSYRMIEYCRLLYQCIEKSPYRLCGLGLVGLDINHFRLNGLLPTNHAPLPFLMVRLICFVLDVYQFFKTESLITKQKLIHIRRQIYR